MRSDLIDIRTIKSSAIEQERVSGILYVDRQFFSIAWGVFYWSVSGLNIKHIYDVRCDSLDQRLSRMELIPPEALSAFHRTFLADNESFNSEGGKSGVMQTGPAKVPAAISNDHIVGLKGM